MTTPKLSVPARGPAQTPPANEWAAVALRGLVVGVAVVIALILMWLPAGTCVSTAFFACLGTAVVTIFLMPVVAFLVALAVGALVRLRQPWLLALIGPVAAYGSLRVGDVAVGSWRASLIVACVLIALSYVVLALLLQHGTSFLPRAIGVAALGATLVVPGLVADQRAEKGQAASLEALGVPLLLADIDGYDVQTVTPLPGGQVAGEVARLRYDLVREGDSASTSSTILVDVTAVERATRSCDDLPTVFPDQNCDEVGAARWLLRGTGFTGVQLASLVVLQNGAVLIASAQDPTLSTDVLRDLDVREVTAADLAALS